jgi:hypothetical protein
MRTLLSRPRFFAAIAAFIAFVGTFAVSAHAVMADASSTRTYKIVAIEDGNDKYAIGRTVNVTVNSDHPDVYIEIADGVWAELMPEA